MMPLSMARFGERGNIVKISGASEVKRHLENLGFVVGEHVTVVGGMAGDVIVGVKGTRIAINKSMACRIMVA